MTGQKKPLYGVDTLQFPAYVRDIDLKLGDVVECFEGAWGTGTVQKVGPGWIQFHRPYGACSDFSVSGGEPGAMAVICYTGLEQTKIENGGRLYLVYHRKEIK